MGGDSGIPPLYSDIPEVFYDTYMGLDRFFAGKNEGHLLNACVEAIMQGMGMSDDDSGRHSASTSLSSASSPYPA